MKQIETVQIKPSCNEELHATFGKPPFWPAFCGVKSRWFWGQKVSGIGMQSYAVEVQLLGVTILCQLATCIALVGIVQQWNELSSASIPQKRIVRLM